MSQEPYRTVDFEALNTIIFEMMEATGDVGGPHISMAVKVWRITGNDISDKEKLRSAIDQVLLQRALEKTSAG